MVVGKQMDIQNALTGNIACFRNLTLAIYGCFGREVLDGGGHCSAGGGDWGGGGVGKDTKR